MIIIFCYTLFSQRHKYLSYGEIYDKLNAIRKQNCLLKVRQKIKCARGFFSGVRCGGNESGYYQ